MKTPTFDWENSSGAFREAFNEWPQYNDLSRDDVEDILTLDLARAQRIAATGLRHLRAILGARTNDGIRDRWRRDALAVPYFGKTSSVANIRAVHRRLERAHRRLRDDRLHIRLRPQSTATSETTSGRNDSFFIAPKRFELYPYFAGREPAHRSAIIVHELLHEWLRDQSIGDNTVTNDSEARRLASRDPEKARRNPENYERFLLQVWADEGLEAPSGAILNDDALTISASAAQGVTGALADRPVLADPSDFGRRDLVFAALRAEASSELIPALFEVDATPLRRLSEQGGAVAQMSYPAACCTLSTNVVLVASRSPQSRRMELRAWEMQGERLLRLGDSGTLFRDCFSQPDVIALGPEHFCLVYKIKNGRMRVELMEFSRAGRYWRIAHAETHGPMRDHGRAVLVSPVIPETGQAPGEIAEAFVVATAFRTREGKLSFDLWELSRQEERVERRGGLVDHEMTGRPSLALAKRRGRWCAVTAARDKSTGRLRLTSFDPADPARPRRLGDTGDSGARMTHSPDIVTVVDGPNIALATAVRYVTDGRLIVSLWRAGTRNRLFLREHDSGWRSSPELKGSPSLVALPGQTPARLVTAGVGADNGLALHRWEVRDPTRV